MLSSCALGEDSTAYILMAGHDLHFDSDGHGAHPDILLHQFTLGRRTLFSSSAVDNLQVLLCIIGCLWSFVVQKCLHANSLVEMLLEGLGAVA